MSHSCELFHRHRQPAWVQLALVRASSEQWLLREATGHSRHESTSGTEYGPFSAADAQKTLLQQRSRYLALGYLERNLHTPYLQALGKPDRTVRARAAVQLGWRRPVGTLDALLQAASEATLEISSIVDALGRAPRGSDAPEPDPISATGRERLLNVLRDQASKKLLSRRRSGVEAIRALVAKELLDPNELSPLRALGLARLPPSMAEFLGQIDLHRSENLELLQKRLSEYSGSDLGLILDQLYEFDTPVGNQAVLMAMQNDAFKPGRFRYSKSLLKRALLRLDFAMLTALARLFERTRGSKQKTSVKSGLDGQQKLSPIYSRTTRAWLLRAIARHFRRTGQFRPEHYVPMACDLLASYQIDIQKGALRVEGAFLLEQLLYGKSMRRQTVPPMVRLEKMPFAALWSAQLDRWVSLWNRCDYHALRLGIETTLLEAPERLRQLRPESLVLVFGIERLRASAQHEIERRFNKENPDLALALALLGTIGAARTLGSDLLRASQDTWSKQPDALEFLLSATSSDVNQAAAERIIEALDSAQPEPDYQSLLLPLLNSLTAGDLEQHAGRLTVLEHFAPRLVLVLNSAHLLAMLELPLAPVQVAAASLVRFHAEALANLSTERMLTLCDSSIAPVRRHGMAIVSRCLDRFHDDAWGLLRLADGRFEDTRAQAFTLVQALDFRQFGLSALISLCDSNQPQVQGFARQWVRDHLAEVDAEALMLKLVEHPHRAMQSFALELLEQTLAPGAKALASVLGFLQASLRRPLMRRADKDRILRVLQTRGLLDSEQGVLAVSVLNDSLRTATRIDREGLMSALSTLLLAYPGQPSDLKLLIGAPIEMPA